MAQRRPIQQAFSSIFLLLFVFQLVTPIALGAGEADTKPVTTNLSTTDQGGCQSMRDIDRGTFNEYCYKITKQYFSLREKFKVDGSVDTASVEAIVDLATKGYRYLPDNLNNENKYNELVTASKRAIKYPDSDTSYTDLVKKIQDYIESRDIKSIKGTIEATPKTGNAPLTVTMRGQITDPTGTQIPKYNYIWWIDNAGKKQVIGNQISLNYTFREEGNFSVFLDVVSSHKNQAGYTDVLPFSSRVDIKVQEKIASLILQVNGEVLNDKDTLKFTPEEAKYGLIFDATSSTPTSGTKFIQTEWVFGNGLTRSYNGAPKVERIVYATEGTFPVTLKMKTNELKTIERKFDIEVHNPIATIQSSSEEGFIGDKFTFKARTSGKDKSLVYAWQVIDIDKAEVITKKEGSNLSYTFAGKGKFNIQLKTSNASGEENTDSKIIYINSRAPFAEFSTKVQRANRPNTIIFDASKSYDLDYTDDGKLAFNWIIDGEKVILEDANYNGSVGSYTFDSVGDHSVVLEVVDLDGITALKKSKVNIASVLAVDLYTFPRVIQRDQFVKFEAASKEASLYEWDFGDGEKDGGKGGNVTHIYKKSGIFDVKITVHDVDGAVNTDTKKVYVGTSDAPVAFLKVEKGSAEVPVYDEKACGQGAFIVDKVTPIKFDAGESINIDGQTSGVTYSWKIGQDKFSTAKSVSHTFDEIGCFPVKLSVKSDKNGKTDVADTMVKVENVAPILSSLSLNIVDPNTDPVVVNVNALGAKDPDGVIQSYLWYYYTDTNSDPQDFRATTQPKTTFVLPKVTGNYYFVLVMKDNNEVKVNSEEIAGQKYSITLSGDNVNTPIVDMKVNDSSVSVGDPVVFSAQAKDILGKDIGDKADYYWDFDGDGFYDKQTKESTITYAYQKSGDFFAKVKVKNKGFSNVRTISINVTNKIVADFNYISIGNTFALVNTSQGKADSVSWNLGDGTRIEGKNTVNHTYTDGQKTHTVELTVAEGTKVKKITKKLLPDIGNILKARKNGLNVFTYPSYDEKGKILLTKNTDKLYIYLGQSKGEIEKYAIDFDTETDSDINGGKDDDEDNTSDASIKNGDAVEVKLNAQKIQHVRAFIKNVGGTVLESFDIEVQKDYITDASIDPSTINFVGITNEEKLELEKVKAFIVKLPESQKNDGLKLLAKLQEDWLDNNEKTKTILALESFLDTPDITGGAAIIDILEGLLVAGQDDKSQKNIAFNALSSLIPETITCTTPDASACKPYIISLLEKIKMSTDIEANKKTGSEILTLIGSLEGMTDKEKLDFKAVLKTFVYGGVSNIPEVEKQEVATVDTSTTTTSWITKILKIIAGILLAIIGIFVFGGIIFWIFYKLSNKDTEVSFQDFIIKKTSGTVPQKNTSGEVIDILTPHDIHSESPVDIFAQEPVSVETSIPTVSSADTIPDWLKGASDLSPTSSMPVPTPVETVVGEDTPIENIPPVEEEKHTITLKKEETIASMPTPSDWMIQDTHTETPPSTESVTDDEIPDWLKGVSTEETSINADMVIEQPVAETEEVPADVVIETPVVSKNSTIGDVDDVDMKIPDWLKGSFDEASDTKTVIKLSDTEKVVPEKIVEEDNEEEDDEESSEVTLGTPDDTKPKKKRKRRKKKVVSEGTNEEVILPSIPAGNEDDLWQDGMKVPNWLQDTPQPDDTKK